MSTRDAAPRCRSPRSVALLLLTIGAAVTQHACTDDNGFIGSVDLGNDIIAPDLVLDEETFVCRIQPEILTRHSCARGMSGEGGSCHDSRSALRLLHVDEAAPCNSDDEVIGPVPDRYLRNFEAIRLVVQADPESSPLYLRPIGRASHPRTIYNASDPAAELIATWIAQGAR